MAVWGDCQEDERNSFTLADNQGMVIPEMLIIDQPDGTDKELPCSLETYMQITKKAYTTQPRFNVLRTTRSSKLFCNILYLHTYICILFAVIQY